LDVRADPQEGINSRLDFPIGEPVKFASPDQAAVELVDRPGRAKDSIKVDSTWIAQ
jgi:hypothetical protein